MVYPRDQLPRRFRSLAVLELWNAVVTLPIFFLVLRWSLTGPNLAGAASVAVPLAVGSGYWWAKLRQLERRTRLPEGLRIFARLRLPVWLLALSALAYALIVGLGRGFQGVEHLAEWAPGAGLAIFGLLEVVNYFHIQLSHDNRHDLQRLRRKGLGPSPLARDIAAWRRSRVTSPERS